MEARCKRREGWKMKIFDLEQGTWALRMRNVNNALDTNIIVTTVMTVPLFPSITDFRKAFCSKGKLSRRF